MKPFIFLLAFMIIVGAASGLPKLGANQGFYNPGSMVLGGDANIAGSLTVGGATITNGVTGGDLTMGAGYDFACEAGDTKFDFNLGTGIMKTTRGLFTHMGPVYIPSGVTLLMGTSAAKFGGVVTVANLASNGTISAVGDVSCDTGDTTGEAATIDQVWTRVNKSGDAFSGVISMGGNKINTLASPTVGTDAATYGTVLTKINKSGDAFSGVISMGGNKINTLGAPTVGTDAANFASVLLKMNKSGDAFTGAIDMGAQKIGNLGAPTVGTDAANFASVLLKMNKSGGAFSGTIDMGANKIGNLGAPAAGTDAANFASVLLKVNKSGDTLSGALAMGNNKVSGLAAPTTSGDAARIQDVWGCLNKTGANTIATSGTLALTDADSLTIASKKVPTEIPIATFDYSASSVDQAVFTAKGAWTLTAVKMVPAVAGVDGSAVTVMVKICDDAEAPGSGDNMLSGTLDLKGAAHTLQSGTVSAGSIADGKIVALDFTGTLTSAVGTITLYGQRA